MKCLSIKQPYANWIAYGPKSMECRTWSTNYRGPLLIASSLRPAISPAGMAIALVELVDCRLMRPEDEDAAQVAFYDDTVVWVLDNIRIIEPIPVKGALSIYERPIKWEDLVFVEPSDVSWPVGEEIASTPRPRKQRKPLKPRPTKYEELESRGQLRLGDILNESPIGTP